MGLRFRLQANPWCVLLRESGWIDTHAGGYQVLIKHRATDDALTLVENILAPLRSRYVYLSYEDHDIVTANTQAVTHAAFLRCAAAT